MPFNTSTQMMSHERFAMQILRMKKEELEDICPERHIQQISTIMDVSWRFSPKSKTWGVGTIALVYIELADRFHRFLIKKAVCSKIFD